jgi:hypothetical protein
MSKATYPLKLPLSIKNHPDFFGHGHGDPLVQGHTVLLGKTLGSL